MLLVHYEQSILIIVVLMIYLLSLETAIGPIKLVHTFETCVDSAAGFAFSILFISMIAAIYISQLLVKEYGAISMFGFFACFIFLSCLYILFFWKDTTFKQEKVL